MPNVKLYRNTSDVNCFHKNIELIKDIDCDFKAPINVETPTIIVRGMWHSANYFYIPMFNMLIVFGIAIRGMYPWPIILYLNTSNQPINILTPLVAILDQLKDAFYSKLGQIEQIPIQGLANFYINKLNNEINEIKKENIKLDTYKTVIKSITLPKGMKLKEEFAKTVNQNVDTRQLITRIETLSKKKKLKRDANQNSVEQPHMQNIMTGVSSVLNPQTEK